MTAAVQMKLFLDKNKVNSMIFFYDHYTKGFSYPKQSFLQFSPEKTIFLDLSDGFVSEIIADLGNATGPFLDIDHHQRDVVRGNAFKSIVIKPSSFSEIEPSKYPTSKMVFDLFGGRDWICSIGVIGDFAMDTWGDFLKKTATKHKLAPKKLATLAEIVECITSQYSEKINSLAEFLISVKSPKLLLTSEYVGLKKLFDARLKLLKEKFYKENECYDDAQLCFFKSDNRFSGKLSTIISTDLPNKTIIIFEQPGDSIKCSIRRQDFNVNCGNLARAGVKDIPQANGGGHIPAAGAHFPPQYLDQFKKNVRMYLLENPPKGALNSRSP
ncbi:MAG: DHH family phosphoesterase [archaeon]